MIAASHSLQFSISVADVDHPVLGRRQLDIDKAWSAKAPSTVTLHHATGSAVHRIKVDEKAGYILTTRSDGGLTVTDLDEDVVLWSLPPVCPRVSLSLHNNMSNAFA